MDFTDNSMLIKEHTECLNSATREVECLIENTIKVFDDLSKITKIKNAEEKKKFQEYEHYSKIVNNYIEQTHREIPSLVNVIKTSDKQLTDNRKDIENLTLNVEKQKQQIDELKKELEEQKILANEYKQKYEKSKEDCSLHLTYSAAMGSVLATMLWKTSKSQEAIDTYIETGTLNQFLNLANNTIISFQEAFPLELPHGETFELKFIVSLLGICINVAAQRTGREYLLERTIGEDFVKNIVKFVGYMPITGGKLLTKLTLMFLYNLTFSKQGTILIQNSDGSVDNIIKCFSPSQSIEVQSIAVSLMNLLLKETQTNGFCSKVTQKLSQNEDDFKNLIEKADATTKDICNQLLRKLREMNDDLSFDGGF